jgi:hypothetical protein
MEWNKRCLMVAIVSAVVIAGGEVSWAAADTKASAPAAAPTREERIQMLEKGAKIHQDAADCLKAGKSEQECKEAMMKECQQLGHGGRCPMMDEGMCKKHGYGHGPHHDHGRGK